MKNTFLPILIIVFASCKSVAISQNIEGQFFKVGKDYQYSLVLNKDSSFSLTQKYFEVNSSCKGKWQYLSADTILLKCNEEDLSAKLQSGYMSEREKKVFVVSKKKLKLGGIVLKKESE